VTRLGVAAFASPSSRLVVARAVALGNFPSVDDAALAANARVRPRVSVFAAAAPCVLPRVVVVDRVAPSAATATSVFVASARARSVASRPNARASARRAFARGIGRRVEGCGRVARVVVTRRRVRIASQRIGWRDARACARGSPISFPDSSIP
jgi:hypothetical protein